MTPEEGGDEPRDLILLGVTHRLEAEEGDNGEVILTVWSMGGRGCAVLDQAHIDALADWLDPLRTPTPEGGNE